MVLYFLLKIYSELLSVHGTNLFESYFNSLRKMLGKRAFFFVQMSLAENTKLYVLRQLHLYFLIFVLKFGSLFRQIKCSLKSGVYTSYLYVVLIHAYYQPSVDNNSFHTYLTELFVNSKVFTHSWRTCNNLLVVQINLYILILIHLYIVIVLIT